MGDSLIDWARVEELRNEVGAEDFPEIVEVFLEEVDESIADLTATAATEELMHFLKGAALNLGLRDMAALCARGEQDRAGNDTLSIDLAALGETYAASRAELLARYPLPG